MAPHSSTLAWKIPWTEEPGRLQSMASLRVGHNCATSLSLFTFMHQRRKQQPTPVFLPGESQGRGSLVGCHLWGHIESDTTEVTQQQQQVYIYDITQFSFSHMYTSTFFKVKPSILHCSYCAYTSFLHTKKDHVVIYTATCPISQGCETSHEITDEKVLWQL